MRAAKFLMAMTAIALSATAAHADLAISSDATANVCCSSGVCTATARNAVLNAGDLASMLASGDATVKTGGGATNIVVKAGVSWTSTSRLTLDANQSMKISKPVSVTGSGAVTITTNDGGSGGDLMFDGNGNVKFWDTGSSLVINGNSYTLVKDIATLASDIAAKPSGFYAFANDYDASSDGTYSSSPVTTPLTGTFEGLGHAISNLKIVSSDTDVALFAEVGGTMRDVDLTNISVDATGSEGVVVGTLLARSVLATIVGCSASGSVVFGFGSGGGLVGASGQVPDRIIARSHSSVSISGGDSAYVGGLVGVSGFSISLSYATGSVKAGNNASAGGLFGEGGNVSQSFSSGNVSGGANSSIGGLIGIGSGIDNSYATGTTTGAQTAIVGGLVGQAGFGEIVSSYATGRVKGGSVDRNAGGLLGYFNDGQPPRLSSDYWDMETTGRGRRAGCGSGNGNCGRGAKGLRTEEFQSDLPAGFDPAIWGENANINGGFPYLLALPRSN